LRTLAQEKTVLDVCFFDFSSNVGFVIECRCLGRIEIRVDGRPQPVICKKAASHPLLNTIAPAVRLSKPEAFVRIKVRYQVCLDFAGR
jgi:inorganic pyrophosphatase